MAINSLIYIVLASFLATRCFCIQELTHRNVRKDQYLEAPVGTPQIGKEAWEELLRENLGQDLERWKARAPLNPTEIPKLHQSLLDATGLKDSFHLVLVYNNRIYYPNQTRIDNLDLPAQLPPQGLAFHRKVSALLSTGKRTLPNALFVYSFDDNRPRFCSPAGPHCKSVPLFSQIKTVGEKDGDDLDILVPQWMFTPSSLFFYPWHLKKDRAFFRGEPFCSGHWAGRYRCHDACPRTALAQLSARDRQAGNDSVLDVGLVGPVERAVAEDGSPLPRHCIKMDLPVAERTPIPAHSYYKWLLHLEGITASSRLSQLMLVNSLVVMQRQPFIEYFYRSLRPGVHYVPFWNATGNWHMDDVYDVVAELRRRDQQDPEGIQRVIREAQDFALRFTMPPSRFQYLRDALLGYRQLFPDMDSFLEGYVRQLRQRGFPIA